jgi:hypothetical protein
MAGVVRNFGRVGVQVEVVHKRLFRQASVDWFFKQAVIKKAAPSSVIN